MSARAVVQDDWMRNGIKVAVVLRSSDHDHDVIHWGAEVRREPNTPAAEQDDSAWLRLDEDAGRALYEALARHYGGISVDAASLRKDYDAERKRVDTFISHLTKAATS